MKSVSAQTLRVAGASLYYQVRGSGPVLLMMPGGHGDADSFDGIADQLTGQYTVVSYDRRGYARSPLDNPDAEQRVAEHGDDAAALLATFGDEPARVFGSSTGALIGLDLVARRPHLVSAFVAHEPPAVSLLPVAERPPPPDALMERLRRDGPGAALDEFRSMLGVTDEDAEPDTGAPPARSPHAAANAAFFFNHEAAMLDRFTPDITALRAASTRIVPAGGRTGRQYFPYRCADALARRLGERLVEFPGGHAGFVSHPTAFANELRAVLGR